MTGSRDPLSSNEEQDGRKALAGWVGHPGVRKVIEQCSAAAEAVTMPVQKFLVDQVQVIRFTTRICDIAVQYPDGTEEPNPFTRAGPEAWPMTPAEREAALVAAQGFRELIELAAAALRDVGVPLDVEWNSDLAVVGQLLLMADDIPWSRPAAELADLLQPSGVSALTRDARSVTARDGRSSRAAENIDKIRVRARTDLGAPSLRMPYAGGGRRASQKPTTIRREIVREVRKHFPDATVSKILQTFDNSDQTPGGRLRTKLRERLGPEAPKPSKSALHSDFRLLDEQAESGG